MLFRLSLLAMLLATCLVPASFVRSEDTPRPVLNTKDIDSLLRTDWFGIYFQGKKIGYFRAAYESSGDYYRESATFSMKVASFGQKSEIFIKETAAFENKAPYRLLRTEMDQRNEPTPPENFLLVRKDKGFEFTYRTGKETSKKQSADLDYTLADALALGPMDSRQPQGGGQGYLQATGRQGSQAANPDQQGFGHQNQPGCRRQRPLLRDRKREQ